MLINSVLFKILFVPLIGFSFNTSDISSVLEKYKNQKIISEYHKNIQKFTNHTEYPKDTQFVLLQFDGSYSLEMWKKTQDFSKKLLVENKPVRFTYFISGVYFVPEALKNVYDLDGYRAGHSDIGWGDDVDDIAKRFAFVNDAYKFGHEIGSHANGHFNGSDWTQKQWEQEFEYFNRFIFSKNKERGSGVIFPKSEITGFRAPLLGHNDAMYEALKNYGFTYETNKVFMQNRLVEKQNTIWNFPLYGVNIGGRNTIAMDYNLYYLQSKAKSTLTFGTPEWKTAHKNALTGYLNYFYAHYNFDKNDELGLKAPVTIGHHFSLWNDGLYWSVMKDFAKEVCGKEKVVCGTGQEYQAFLESWGK
ncbi:TPA: hypothetical protein EYG84_03810 [Candidatus Gracilibacteria bacterium]|nr:hypothetical protein [Candidatus Gracilibacteria bacterium]